MPGERTETEAIPLEPDRRYDMAGGEHLGHAAALNVPCSEGPAELAELDRVTDESALMAAEPPIEPARQMEAGSDWDDETVARLRPLFTPIQTQSPDDLRRLT